jgi:hypothetical protein
MISLLADLTPDSIGNAFDSIAVDEIGALETINRACLWIHTCLSVLFAQRRRTKFVAGTIHMVLQACQSLLV